MKRICALVTLLSILMVGCGQNDDTGVEVTTGNANQLEISETEEVSDTVIPKEKTWAIDEQVLPDADDAVSTYIPQDGEILTEEWYLVENIIYRITSIVNVDPEVPNPDYFKGHCVQTLEQPYQEWNTTYIAPEDWAGGDICSPWVYNRTVVNSSGVWVLLAGQNGTYLGNWNEENGASTKSIDRNLLMTEDSESYLKWWCDSQGALCVWNDDSLVSMDSNFTVLNTLKSEDGYCVRTPVEDNQNGQDYLICPEQFEYNTTYRSMNYSGFQMLSGDGTQVLLSNSDLTADDDGSVYFVSDTEGYLYQMFQVVHFSLQDGTMEVLHDFEHDDVYHDKMHSEDKELKYMNIVNGIRGGHANPDGSHMLLVACSDDTWQIWNMREQDDTQSGSSKQQLEWATTVLSNYEKRVVERFNQQNDTYEIKVRIPGEGESFDDFRTRIQAELTAGEGPDLLSAGSVVAVDDGARMGVLADITEDVEEFSGGMLKAPWETGMVQDRRYAVPYSYTINTIVTGKDFVGNRQKWTLEEAMECMKKSNAKYFMAGADKASLFFYLGLQTESNRELLDWQEEKCHLDSDKGVALLEFAQKYEDPDGNLDSLFLEASEGEAATVLLYLMSPEDMRAVAALYHDEEVYIGFPAEGEESGHIIQESALAVNQGSTHREGAIAFIRFLLSEETQTDIAQKVIDGKAFGFPVEQKAMEQIYNYLQQDETKDKVNTYSGLEYTSNPLSDESIEKLRDMVNTARPVGQRANKIFDIVSDEIGEYKPGGKSAGAVLQQANNRAQLYMDEMR